MNLFKSKPALITFAVITVAGFLSGIFYAAPFIRNRPDVVLGDGQMTPHWDQRSIYYFENLMLDRGIYSVDVVYDSEFNLEAQMKSAEKGKVSSTPVVLWTKEMGRESFRIMVREDDTACYLEIREADYSERYTPATFQIRIVYRPKLTVGYRVLYVFFLFFAAVAVAALFFFFRAETDTEKKKVVGVLLILFLFVAIPCSLEYVGVPDGRGDAEYHMYRMAHMSESMFENGFQMRLQSGWHRDYGYPVSIYYGEILLAPAAALYAAGLPLWQCYQVYLGLILLMAVVVAYRSFLYITENVNMGLLGSVLYITSLRFLCVGHVFCAMGEIAAMMFLPLAAAGLCLLMRTGRINEGVVLLVIAFTGMLQTHPVTVTRAAMFAALFCVFEWRRFFCKAVLVPVLKGVAAGILLNLWFLVPFVDFFLKYESGKTMHNIGSSAALDLPNLFFTGEKYTGIGLALTLFLVLSVLLFFTGRTSKRINGHLSVLLLLSLFALLLTSKFMPYEWLLKHTPRLYAVLGGGIQHAWRYATMATILIIVFGLYVLRDVVQNGKPDELRLVTTSIAIICAVSILNGASLMMYAGFSPSVTKMNQLDDTALDMYGNGTVVFLLDGSVDDYDAWVRGPVQRDVRVEGGDTEITDISRRGTSFRMHVINNADQPSYVVFPLWNYDGYVAEGEGNRFEISDGIGRTVKVTIPAGFSGELSLRYCEALYWKLADFISIISLILFVAFLVRRRRRKYRTVYSHTDEN